MKRTLCAAFIAAALLLAGCSDTSQKDPDKPHEIIYPNSPGNAGSSSSNTGSSGDVNSSWNAEASGNAESSSGGEASSSTNSSSNINSSSNVSSSSNTNSSSNNNSSSSMIPAGNSSEVPDIGDGKIELDKSYTVKSGETLRIKSGETVLINGRLLCANGGKIVVDKGGSLMVNGEIELSGKLELNGELGLAEGAKIYGEGAASVNSFDDIDCKGDFTARIIPPAPVVANGVTTVGGVLIVNKKISLPATYGSGLDAEALSALKAMRKASGYSMPVISGFRSYEKQQSVFANWCAIDGEEVASTYSARPGHSEHQSGLGMDITSLYQSYGETAEGKWLAKNCYKYGFIIRYPLGKDDITGYMYEPWHLRYLGESTAKLVYDSGLTLDEFLGVDS